MKRILLPLAAVAAIALVPAVASAKSQPRAPKPGQLTQTDLRTCMGLNGSKPQEQIPACTKIINSGNVKHPYEADYYATRGAAYLATHQYEQALADTNKALSVRKAAEFYFQRGIINMSLRQPDAAKADFAEVMKLKPQFAPTYLMRGLVSYTTGDYAEAVTYFNGAVQRQPTYYQALFARGAAKKKSGDTSGGDKDIAAARGMSAHVDDDMKRFGVVP
jgi:tetratricopeptide (TPR) repeat protein